MHALKMKRAYDSYEKTDGVRILIDRLWPRGIKKENAHIDQWLKEIAPSEELRKWFHQEKDFSEFKKRYQKELKKKEVHEVVEELLKILEKDTVTLIYSAKDEVHNNAVVLQSYLQDARRKK